MRYVLLLFAFSLLGASILTAQRASGIAFGNWSGSLYSINDLPQSSNYRSMDRHEAYVDFVESVKYDSLYFPEMDTYGWWPGSATNGSFAMDIHSDLTVAQAGCYEITLRSDDGSRLWLDDSLFVDNGILHKMSSKGEKRYFEQGTYRADLWYLSVLPSKMGLEVSIKALPNDESCTGSTRPAPIVLNGAALFESGAHRLSTGAEEVLRPVCERLQAGEFSLIEVIGHTDDVGTLNANLKLSRQRAGAVAGYLRTCMSLDGKTLKVDGRAASEPVAGNDTEAGRAKNRRVEVWIE